MTTYTLPKNVVKALLAVTLVIAGASSPASAKEPTAKEKANFNKSVAAVMGGIASLKGAEANSLKTMGDYLHKMTTIRQLQEQIRQQRMANDMTAMKNWYAKKKLYIDYHKDKARKRPVAKKLEEIARSQAPARLTSYQPTSSELSWPYSLANECYSQKRAELERLMTERIPENSGVGSQNCEQTQQAVGQMKTMLKERVKETNPTDYMAAKKFLDTLAFESQFVFTSTPGTSLASK